jgi:hypothetical protein
MPCCMEDLAQGRARCRLRLRLRLGLRLRGVGHRG